MEIRYAKEREFSPKRGWYQPQIITCLLCGEDYTKEGFLDLNKHNDFFVRSEEADFVQKIPVCYRCYSKMRKRIFEHFLKIYTDLEIKNPEYKALERVCMILNLYYSDDIVEHLKKHYSTKSWQRNITNGCIVDNYIGYVTNTKRQKFMVTDKSYDDTLLEKEGLQKSFESNDTECSEKEETKHKWLDWLKRKWS